MANLEKEITTEMSRRPLMPLATTAPMENKTENKTTAAMAAVDAAELHDLRAIQAMIHAAMVKRILQARGQANGGGVTIGANDVYAAERAFEWIMSIRADNAHDIPTP